MTTVRSRSGLGWYVDRIKSTPLLTAEQERQLARRIRERSDPIAREDMIAANLRLVVKIAKQYYSAGMTLGDLVAEGNLGLMRAVEEFDPAAGVRFSTYAAWWIKQTIKRALINAGQPIHIPAYMSKLISKWRKGTKELEARLGRPPTIREMARKLKISLKKAQIIKQGLLAVNAPNQIGAEATQAMAEMVSDPDVSSPEQALLKAGDLPMVRSMLKQLEPRERKIVELRYGLDGWEGPQRTYKQIGKIIGLTRERVRQLEKQALGKLKAVTD
ncbi:MAG TPA: sigma-70 family RNA polymerase sigma factor [Phycisphaerae bacterium]|nr:sigma-70 family RNA polymerase sigma factor [Phycisphaerae bacterium]